MTQPAKLPSGERARLAALKKLQILDSLQEPLFDEITKVASKICGVPIALISLIDENRQWFKANIGLEGVTETPRDIAFCSHAILQNEILEVPDATLDDRFAKNPLVTGKPSIRFYAGAPLILPTGEKVGTLCVISQIKHQLNETQKNIFTALAGIVVQALVSRQAMIAEVQEKSSILTAIVESSDDAIISKSLEGFVLTWNHGAEQIFGYKSNEIIGRHITCLFPTDRLTEEEVLLKKIRDCHPVDHFETQRITKNGDLIDVSVTLSPIENTDGALIGISEIARNISMQKRLQNLLLEEHERRKVTMDAIGDAVITADKNGNIEHLNPIAEKLTGWQTEEALGLPLHHVFNTVSESTRLPCINPIELCMAENRTVGIATHTMLISRDGTEYGIEESAAPIKDTSDHNIGAVLVFRDVTVQRLMSKEMSYRASHDALTGLINRGEFEHKLEQALISGRERNLEHALLYIDLDQFKIVNDSSGHNAGDTLLKELSIVISGCIRTADTFARIGGDEFGILLENCNVDNAMRIAQSICKSVDEYRFIADKRRHRVGASIGLVMIDDNWLSINHLLQAADQSCYAAKVGGRNRVHLYLDKDHALQTHLGEVQWASRIEQAIEDNDFVLYCQRILPLKAKGGLHGEILLRLKDEHGELIPPGAFLPAAERYHMASRIDKWVVREVFKWMQLHQKMLQHIETISINLSGQSLGDKNFSDYVLELIHNNSIDCSQLCFEITETAAITNINVAEKFIDSMKKHQIKFSLDDFGSGVSSFGYLKKLDVDYIKIDGMFIKGLTTSPIDQATVRCITEVAKVTGKKTIAEWVENEPTEKLLKEMGVNYTQGYLKHKPAPLEHMLEVKCSYKQLGVKSKRRATASA